MRRHLAWTLVALSCLVSAVGAGARLPFDDDEAALALDPRATLETAVALAVAAGSEGLILDAGADGLYPCRGLYTSPVIAAPGTFNAVLFSYRADLPPGTSLQFFVRAWHGDQASRWHRVDRESEALFEAPARSVQYRIILGTRSLDRTPVVREVTLLFADANLSLPTLATVPAVAVEPPPVTERAAWGAREPSSSYTDHAVDTLIVHHTSQPTQAAYAGAATIRGIQKYHMDDRHWIDIGYHFLVGPEGTVYRGRPETASGAHCIPNPGKLGVSVIGDYQAEQPTDPARAALVRLLAHLAGKNGLAVERIFGHKDFMSTDCPGANLYGLLPDLRAEVKALLEAAAPR